MLGNGSTQWLAVEPPMLSTCRLNQLVGEKLLMVDGLRNILTDAGNAITGSEHQCDSSVIGHAVLQRVA